MFARSSSSLDFELIFLFFLRFWGQPMRDDGISVVPRAKICFLSPRKKRERVRVVLKRARTTGGQRYIYLYPPNVSLQSRVAVRVVRKRARIRDIGADEFVFFYLKESFCLKVHVLGAKDTQKLREILLPFGNKRKRNCSLCVRFNASEKTVRFFSLFKSR